MHLHIFSDLHADMADIKPIKALPGVDVVVVAGDACEGAVNGFARLREIVAEDVPIVMVMGNHEYYHRTYPDELKLARAEAARFGCICWRTTRSCSRACALRARRCGPTMRSSAPAPRSTPWRSAATA